MAKLLPILLALIGVAGGGAAGYFLRAEPEETSHNDASLAHCPPTTEVAAEVAPDATVDSAFVKFENQFVVPVTASDAVVSLVVLSLTIEVAQGNEEAIFARMPKLRDAFLGVLFDHSSTGGFSVDFVNGRGLETLRRILTETAVANAGKQVRDVLIVDLVKQDV